MKRLLAIVMSAMLLTSTLGMADVVAATPANPVILVPGYNPNPSSLNTLAASLSADGLTVVIAQLTSNDNPTNAQFIKNLAAQKGWAKYDLVAHSMGGLGSRYLIKNLGGQVEHLVDLGTPNHGVSNACLIWWDGGNQMCPSSKFLTSLNSGDETPGTTQYTVVASTSDEKVPYSTPFLSGSCNKTVTGLTHGQLITDPNVFTIVKQALKGVC